MGLTAREQQSLNSIGNRLAGSDPELAALLSMFTWLTSGEEMPSRETVPAGPRRALRGFRRARSSSSLRGAFRHPGSRRAALLSLGVLATAALIVALAFSARPGHGSVCTVPLAITACASPASGHSPGPSPHNATVGQGPQQRAVGIPQTGP